MYHSMASALSFCEITNSGSSTRHWRPDSAEALCELRLGQALSNRYLLVSELGRGGMGKVFLARDLVLDRDVALKVNLLSSGDTEKGLPGMVEEGQLAALVNHSSIASVFDSGVHEGQPYTIFEYINGSNLRQIISQREPCWPGEDVLALLKPLADALDFAHTRGVIHSDLKPENVCLSPNGIPKILDFGIAIRLHASRPTDSFIGTPAYASPEQAVRSSLDGRSDQYALAVMVFELLCGQRPFPEISPSQTLLARIDSLPPSIRDFRNDLPESAIDAVMQALRKEPADRFPTCRDFAEAFEAGLRGRKRGDVFEQRTEIHITETQTESLVAKILADVLESRGYRTWYYQRDALPGIRLDRQVRESLQATRVALLLISRNSLHAPTFTDEVLSAHQHGRFFLPVLVDMSLEEFESHPPAWRAAIGAATIIEFRRNQIEGVLNRLLRSLELLEVPPALVPKKTAETKRVALVQTWATDSNQIDNRDLPRIVFRNQVINDYLNRPNKYFLSAVKGLGKTLLMKFKRLIMTPSDQSPTVCMIPSGQPYLDFMSEMKLLSKHYESQLSDLSFCKRLWGAAIRISILSHHRQQLMEDQQGELAAFPRRIQRWLTSASVEPTVVFKELTNLPVSDVNRLIDNTENFLDEQIRGLHRATFVFIDRVDQAVRHLSRGAWIHIQAGLIEAAWEVMSANSHIKIHASIRQEAFANFQSDIKANLLGATTLLRYSEEELRSLLDQLTSCYEGIDRFQAFVGVNVIKHPRRPFPEDSFEFCKRYTFGRPRDFVAIAAELSAAKSSLDEQRYCDVIRQTSAVGLVPSLFDENKVFLDCLFDRNNQSRLFELLRTNIFTRQQAISISKRFNGLPDEDSYEFDEESGSIFHPFRDLFLTGLLGFVKRNDQDVQFQSFRQPDGALGPSTRDLPFSSHYFIHPALSEYIQQSRMSGDYRVIQHVLVGENAAWQPFDPIILQIELALCHVSELDLRNRVHAMLSEAKMLKLSGSLRSVRSEMEASRECRELMRVLSTRGYDDVVLWFEELLES